MPEGERVKRVRESGSDTLRVKAKLALRHRVDVVRIELRSDGHEAFEEVNEDFAHGELNLGGQKKGETRGGISKDSRDYREKRFHDYSGTWMYSFR